MAAENFADTASFAFKNELRFKLPHTELFKAIPNFLLLDARSFFCGWPHYFRAVNFIPFKAESWPVHPNDVVAPHHQLKLKSI